MLYLVATPIGNLKDITLRALETLKQVDLILCEDTRVTRKLLEHYEIKKPTESYHHHTPESKVKEIIVLLKNGKNIALVTDAGTPGIADPGNKLVAELIKDSSAARLISPIPGPSALATALSIAGFPTDKFVFYGFPPTKKKRKEFWQKIADNDLAVVFYESPHHIIKSLTELKEFSPSRQAMVGRELTKKFETVYRGTLAEIIDQLTTEARGEFVVVLDRQ